MNFCKINKKGNQAYKNQKRKNTKLKRKSKKRIKNNFNNRVAVWKSKSLKVWIWLF